MTAPERRTRNATATRQAILDSAVRSFADAGYDGVGVREIAGAAGVTAMMVNRYFGSKEQLFAEAVEASMKTPGVIPESTRSLARDAATALVSRTDHLEAFLIMLRSVSNPRAVEIVRAAIERNVGRRLARQLPEHGREIRN